MPLLWSLFLDSGLQLGIGTLIFPKTILNSTINAIVLKWMKEMQVKIPKFSRSMNKKSRWCNFSFLINLYPSTWSYKLYPAKIQISATKYLHIKVIKTSLISCKFRSRGVKGAISSPFKNKSYKNAFQSDAYRPLVDRMPACTGRMGVCPGRCLPGGVCHTHPGRHTTPWVDTSPRADTLLGRHPSWQTPPPPICGQTDTCEKITFANFLCGR